MKNITFFMNYKIELKKLTSHLKININLWFHRHFMENAPKK